MIVGSFHFSSTTLYKWPLQNSSKLGTYVVYSRTLIHLKYWDSLLYGFRVMASWNFKFLQNFAIPAYILEAISSYRKGFRTYFLYRLIAYEISFYVIYYMASFDEVFKWRSPLLNFGLWPFKNRCFNFFRFHTQSSKTLRYWLPESGFGS